MNGKTKAIFLMLLSSLSFAIMAFFVKLSGDVPLFQKVFFRDLIVVIFALFGLASMKVSPWGKRENRMRLWLRGFSGFIGVAFYFYSASHMYLSDSTIINKLSPFFTTLFDNFKKACYYALYRTVMLLVYNTVIIAISVTGAFLLLKYLGIYSLTIISNQKRVP